MNQMDSGGCCDVSPLLLQNEIVDVEFWATVILLFKVFKDPVRYGFLIVPVIEHSSAITSTSCKMKMINEGAKLTTG